MGGFLFKTIEGNQCQTITNVEITLGLCRETKKITSTERLNCIHSTVIRVKLRVRCTYRKFKLSGQVYGSKNGYKNIWRKKWEKKTEKKMFGYGRERYCRCGRAGDGGRSRPSMEV